MGIGERNANAMHAKQMMRRLLRRLSRDVVLRRRLPAEFGKVPILVSPDSALSYWKRDIASVDRHLLAMARELVKPGMVVWDIGANVGLFSFAAASLGAQVLAVEGDTWLVNLLQRSVAINHLPVTVLPAAVAEVCGIGRLQLSQAGRASNSLGEAGGNGQAVVTITLDWILRHFPAPQLVKIDIEGMEYAALQGAARTLALKPKVLCEVTQHYEEIGQLLTSAGYVMYAARRKDRTPLQRPSVDTLAVA
jgi:FkbM family methyltransferase